MVLGPRGADRMRYIFDQVQMSHGARRAVRLARRPGGGAALVALGKNPKKSPHVGGLSCELLGVRC